MSEAPGPPKMSDAKEDFPGGGAIRSERDLIFQSEDQQDQKFRFDESVAKVLPDMLRRSIPGYGALLHMIGVLAASRVSDGSRIYDLGCSLGAASLSIRHALGARSANIVAVDESSAMVEACQRTIDADSGLCPVEVLQGDIRHIELSPCSFVVLNFTVQFIPKEERQAIFTKVAEALEPGGTLIVSEKTKSVEPNTDEFFTESHDAFRRSNGYSQLELSRKRQALERVLVPESSDYYMGLLKNSGLKPLEWFRCLHFVSWIATKAKR